MLRFLNLVRIGHALLVGTVCDARDQAIPGNDVSADCVVGHHARWLRIVQTTRLLDVTLYGKCRLVPAGPQHQVGYYHSVVETVGDEQRALLVKSQRARLVQVLRIQHGERKQRQPPL